MWFTSSSDGTTVTPTTPPTSGTDTTANSYVDAGVCESLHVGKLYLICVPFIIVLIITPSMYILYTVCFIS